MQPFTFKVDWSRIPQSSDGLLMLRIAHAVNDIACVSHFMVETTGEDNTLPEYLRNGYQLYCIRLLSGHLHEAVKLAGCIQNYPNLKTYLDQLSTNSRQDYEQILTLQKDGSNYTEFKKYVAGVRDKLAFHYDEKEVEKALKEITQSSDSGNTVIVAETQMFSRLLLADTVMRRELCAIIWQVPATTDEEIEKELLNALNWWNKQVKAFYDFGSELCVLYLHDREQK